MAASKLVRADIKFYFTNTGEPKAKVFKKYEDGSTMEAEGVQSFEKAKDLLDELVRDPIYTAPTTTTP